MIYQSSMAHAGMSPLVIVVLCLSPLDLWAQGWKGEGPRKAIRRGLNGSQSKISFEMVAVPNNPPNTKTNKWKTLEPTSDSMPSRMTREHNGTLTIAENQKLDRNFTEKQKRRSQAPLNQTKCSWWNYPSQLVTWCSFKTFLDASETSCKKRIQERTPGTT